MSVIVGERAPAFELPDTEGVAWTSLGEVPTVVVWTCNHCPYALAWHDRIAEAARDYADRGVRFLMVNSNDAVRYPRDSLHAMRERVAASGADQWPFPYLHDESQAVARAFGAQTTPDVFVLDDDGVVRYRGAPDADHDDPTLRAAWLRDALDAVLDGRAPELPETRPVGCSIKWKLD
jgi:peroxiredoxin